MLTNKRLILRKLLLTEYYAEYYEGLGFCLKFATSAVIPHTDIMDSSECL